VVQDFLPENFEIIIVDNASTDNALNVAKRFARKYPGLVRIIMEKHIQSSYAARNKGINASKGSIIAFIDADMSVHKDWLSKIVNSLEKNQVKYFACKVEIYLKEKNIFGLYNKMTGFPVEHYVINHHFAPTCCLIIRKSVFDKVGLFDSRLISGGDYEFGNRVFDSGYKLYYDNSIVMRHPARSSFRKIFCKFFRTGRGIQQIIFYHSKYYKEIGRNILDLQYYLPDKPWSFSKNMKRYEIWNQSSSLTKIGFYLISWEVKLATQVGYIYEKFRRKVKNKNKID
jgi:glycosyltransferase involved in cell wall biosynthesis